VNTVERVLKPKDIEIPSPNHPITIKFTRSIVRVRVGHTTIAESTQASLASTKQHRRARLPDLLTLAHIAVVASLLFECLLAFSQNSKAPIQLGALSRKHYVMAPPTRSRSIQSDSSPGPVGQLALATGRKNL
jgi:hypothetical protein